MHVPRASADIYLAKTLPLATGKKVAIKEMNLSYQPRLHLIVDEILTLQESQHPNIINFLGSYLSRQVGSDEQLWIVMEYMDGSPLTDIIENKTMEEAQISRVCLEVRPT
jgi:protein-serine/threonine kinase